MTLKTREQSLTVIEVEEANDALYPEFADWLTHELRGLVKTCSLRQPARATAPRVQPHFESRRSQP